MLLHAGAQATWKKNDHLLSEWVEKLCIHMQKLELDPFLTSYTKVIRPKMIRIQENIKENLK